MGMSICIFQNFGFGKVGSYGCFCIGVLFVLVFIYEYREVDYYLICL